VACQGGALSRKRKNKKESEILEGEETQKKGGSMLANFVLRRVVNSRMEKVKYRALQNFMKNSGPAHRDEGKNSG